MRLKIDENLGPSIVALFESAGLDVHSVPQEGLSGSPDDKVLFAAFSEDRALVTLDLDFSNSIRFPPAGKPGVIILRPALPLLSQIRQLAMEAIAYMKTESPRDSIGSLSRGAFAFSRLRWMQDNRFCRFALVHFVEPAL